MQQNPSPWSKVQFLLSGDEYFSRVAEEIDQAQREVFIETYIFDLDPLTTHLMENLLRFRQRGGEVKILVDGVGSLTSVNTLTSWCRDRGLQFQVYRPLSRLWGWFRQSPRSWSQVFQRFNQRDHRKLVIIDRKKVFLGSLNLTAVHSEKWSGKKAWRDLGVLVEGPGVKFLTASFFECWRLARRPRLWPWKLLKTARIPGIESSGVRINTHFRDRRRISRQTFLRLREAQKRICIASAYFLPKAAHLRALRRAAQRGVHVEILWAGPTDVPLVKWAAYGMIKSLLQNGVKVYEFQPTVFHAKYMMIDGWGTVGSANFNHRSLMHDLEVEICLEDASSLEFLEARWQNDLKLSLPVSLEDLDRIPTWQKLISRVAYRMRYLL